MSGAPYRGLALELDPAFLVGRLQGWAAVFLAQFGSAGMALTLAAWRFGQARDVRLRVISLWAIVTGSAFAIGYDAADLYAYLLPAFLVLAVWLGLGIATACDRLGRWPRATLGRWLVAGGLGLTLTLQAARTWPGVDASQHERAEAVGKTVLEAAPAGAVVVTQGDRDRFTLWYFHILTCHPLPQRAATGVATSGRRAIPSARRR